MLKKALIICAVILCSSHLYSQEKWKITSLDTTTFRDYNFIKISLMEAKVTKYLISKKGEYISEQAKYVRIKKGDFVDLTVNPVQSVFTMEMSDSPVARSFRIGEKYITRNDTVQVEIFTSPEVKGQYVKIK